MITRVIVGAKYLSRGAIVEVTDNYKNMVYLVDSDGVRCSTGLGEFMEVSYEFPFSGDLTVRTEDVRAVLRSIQNIQVTLKESLYKSLLSMDSAEFDSLQIAFKDTVTQRKTLCAIFGDECIKKIEETL